MVKIRTPNILVIGGGTGSSIVLKGLKGYDCKLSTLVPMADSGGSTGKLRDEFNVLSAGEIRQRLVALSNEENGSDGLSKLFDYRFEKGKELRGHNVGNIIIAAMTEHLNSQQKSIEVLSKILKLKGEIIPSTWQRFELAADYENGKNVIGEHFIDESTENSRISKLYAQPKVEANQKAIESIREADLIVFGPGDFYTSILHNLVVDGIPEAIMESKAKKIFICNLMTSLGETTGMDLQDLVYELERYIGGKCLNAVIVNSKKLPADIIKKYEEDGQFPIKVFLNGESMERIQMLKADVLSDELYGKNSSDMLERSVLRHDSNKLAATIMNLARSE